MNDFLSDLGAGSSSSSYNSGDAPSILKWLLIIFILLIPVVNIIMLIVWSIMKSNKSRQNFCIATLIMLVIITAIVFALYYFVGFDRIGKITSNIYNTYISKYVNLGKIFHK